MKYEKYKKKCDDKTSVWYYFLRAADSQSCKCNLCQKIIKSIGGTTTGLRVHLKSSHGIDISLKLDIEENKDSSTIQPPSQTTPTASSSNQLLKQDHAYSISSPLVKKRKVTDYFQSSHSMEAIVSRMVALDGLAFSIFCTSEDQRRLFTNSGYDKLPKTPKGIKNIVMNFSEQEKKKLVGELKQHLAAGKKFSLTFDEWTSTRNARYININVHCGDEFADGSHFKNLGLVRIYGSLPAETCIQLLKEKLSEFELSLDGDIVAIVTDGAKVMLKVGKNLKAYHQVCLAHGIQLAVLDVMYKKSIVVENTENVYRNTTQSDQESEDDEMDNTDQGSIVDEDGRLEVLLEPNNLYRYTINSDFKSVIDKVRKVVKLFKNSTVKNDMYLQKHVMQDMGKEL